MSGLKIVKALTKKEQFQLETRERAEAFWEEYRSPSRAEAVQRERLVALVTPHLKEGMRACDLGCGSGEFARWLLSKRLNVSALDVSPRALSLFREKGAQGIALEEGCLPYIKLPQGAFDLVVCADVVAEIDEPLHRLLMSECAELLTKEGKVVFSTPLDPSTFGALERFIALVETEFEILEMKTSSFRLFFEKLTQLLLGDGGLTHVSLIAKKKSLTL